MITADTLRNLSALSRRAAAIRADLSAAESETAARAATNAPADFSAHLSRLAALRSDLSAARAAYRAARRA